MDKKEEFECFCKDMEKITNQTDLKRSITTRRKGMAKVRDVLTFYRDAWSVAESWGAFPKSIVFWLSLTPVAVANFNEFMKFVNAPIAIPVNYGSMLAIAFVITLMFVGVWSYTKIGFNRRSNEIATMHNPNSFYMYKEFEKIKDRLKRIDRELNK